MFARAAKEQEANRVKQTGARVLQADGIEILLAKRALRVDPEVRLGLKRFLGLADIHVEGLHL